MNDKNQTIRALVASLVVGASSLSGGAVWSATQTRTSAFEYNAQGLLSKEIIEPGDPNLCVVTSYTYDSYGNRLTSTTRNCNGSTGSHPGINSEAAAPTGAAVFESRTTTYTYTDDARFVKTATNTLNQTETKEYDARFGAVTKLTGPNGLVTEWQYDGFGRKTLEIQAYAVGAGTTPGTKWEYLYCSGINGGTATCPSGIKGPANAVGTGSGGTAKYVIVTTPVSVNTSTKVAGSALGPASRTYYDEYNRPIRSETQGFDGSGTAQTIYKDTAYNTLGQTAYTSRPYYVGASTVVWDRTEYDLLGRITRNEFQDDQGVSQAQTLAYDGLTTTTVNAKGQQTVKRNNSQGQTDRVTDHNGKVLVYTYDPFGNQVSTAMQGQEATTTITLTYDLRGRKTAMVDPAMGAWSYQYNALGELVSQTDAKAQVTTMLYDKLGRMVQRTEADLTSYWYYDKNQDGTACGKGVGKLCEARSDNGYNRKHTYDNLGRPATSANVIDGVTYTTSSGYDNATGRMTSQTYPTGFSSKFVYTALGYLKELRKNDASNTLYWRADSMDAEGHLKQQTFGNNVQTTKVFNPYTGRITGITGGTNSAVVNLAYTYDSIGNLLTRQDSNQALSETFTMDMLNRITSASINANATGWVTTNYAYDDQGNLICKSDLSACSATSANITYNATAYNAQNQATRTIIHAVASVTGTLHGATNPTYKYDLNGNMTSGAGFTISYATHNRVTQITHASKDGASYLYGAEHQRIREQILTAGTNAVKETTHYLHPDMTNGLFYEKVSVSGSTKHKHYLTAGGEVIAIVEDTVTTTTVTNTRYLHRDYQGSVVAVSNEAGTVLERYAYDAFGKRRYPNGAADPLDAIRANFTDRGYTNHEHLDALGLINMNGRFYDPALGRFMSADPIIQAPDNLQSYNRYSYVMNNPLTLVDPSGFSWLSKAWKKFFRPLVSIAIGMYFPQWMGITNKVAAGFVGGFAGSLAATGDLKAALQGGLTGSAFGYVGSNWRAGTMENYVGHALVGCASSVAMGGKCGNGALAQVVSKYYTIESNGNFVKAVVAGGIAAEIAGGRFADGALTASFGYLFNQCGLGSCRDFFEAAWNKNFFVETWNALVDKISRPPIDLQGQLFASKTAGALMGASLSLGAALDTTGRRACMIETCTLVGPFITSSSEFGFQGALGAIGDEGWSLSIFSTFNPGHGGALNFGYGSDGPLFGLAKSRGLGAGAAIKYCTSRTLVISSSICGGG